MKVKFRIFKGTQLKREVGFILTLLKFGLKTANKPYKVIRILMPEQLDKISRQLESLAILIHKLWCWLTKLPQCSIKRT